MKKVAILGFGGRGKLYASLCSQMPEYYTLDAIIEQNFERLAVAKRLYGLSDDRLFSDYFAFLRAPKRAELLMICTQDAEHYRHAMAALERGYDLLLEKPLATTLEECESLCEAANRLGRTIQTCYVLRYTPFFGAVKEILDSGRIGRLISIEQKENVGHWHQAHSFVRGDWRNSRESSPMIIAKCCHDLDIIRWLAGADCARVSSVGRLCYFTPENAPVGSSDRCVTCAVRDGCTYDAERFYLDEFSRGGEGSLYSSRIVYNSVPSEQAIREAVRTGPFGRCVFHCDNDVVDFQNTTMEFRNGVFATLTMTAFAQVGTRELRVRGTLGEIIGDMCEDHLLVNVFGGASETLDLESYQSVYASHGGGDYGMVHALGEGQVIADINEAMESYRIGFAAERSRLENGKMIEL